jgi:hypothetical protein
VTAGQSVAQADGEAAAPATLAEQVATGYGSDDLFVAAWGEELW